MSTEKRADEEKAHRLREAEQEKLFLDRIKRSLEGKTKDLEVAKSELEKKLLDQSHSTKEAQQELAMLNLINQKLVKKLSDSQRSEGKVSNEVDSSEMYKKIDDLLKVFKQITVSRIAEFAELDADKVLSYLKTLESQGKIVHLVDKKEIVCADCSSLNIEPLFQCPNCSGVNYKQANLIEHYSCGNVTLEETYIDDKCPKCRKKIKVLGVDYRVIKDLFICSDCGNKFPDIKNTFQCQHCNNKFSMAEAKSKTSPLFKMK